MYVEESMQVCGKESITEKRSVKENVGGCELQPVFSKTSSLSVDSPCMHDTGLTLY